LKKRLLYYSEQIKVCPLLFLNDPRILNRASDLTNILIIFDKINIFLFLYRIILVYPAMMHWELKMSGGVECVYF